MNRKLLLTSYCLLVLTFQACIPAHNPADHIDQDEDSQYMNTVKQVNSLVPEQEKYHQTIQLLKDQKPMQEAFLRAVLPASLSGLRRVSVKIGDERIKDLHLVEALYKNKEKPESVALSIIDGAGETGSSILGLSLIGNSIDSDAQTGYGTEKTCLFKDRRVKITENQYAHGEEAIIEWVYKDRYLIKITGENLSLAQMELIIDELQFDKLD